MTIKCQTILALFHLQTTEDLTLGYMPSTITFTSTGHMWFLLQKTTSKLPSITCFFQAMSCILHCIVIVGSMLTVAILSLHLVWISLIRLNLAQSISNSFTKFVCNVYCLPNNDSCNELFDYLSQATDTIQYKRSIYSNLLLTKFISQHSSFAYLSSISIHWIFL